MSDLSETLKKRIAAKVADDLGPEPGEAIESDPEEDFDDEMFAPEPDMEEVEADDEPERDLTLEEAFEAVVNEQEMFNAYQDAHREGYMALLGEGAEANPYLQDEFLSGAWEEGLQDALQEAEVVRVVMAAKALVDAETDEAVDAAVQEIKTSLTEFTEIEALEEFWNQVTSDAG